MKTIRCNIPWRPYQRDFLQNVLATSGEKKSIHTVLSPRQTGKTTCCEMLLIYFSVNFPDSFSLCISPTYKQCKKVYREIYKAVNKIPQIFEGANSSDLEIYFTNGSIIHFSSSESGASSLQGYVIKGGGLCIIDEAAYTDDSIFFAVQPCCQVHGRPIILCSTPKLRDGFFYENYISNSDHSYKYDWSGKTTLSPEELADLKTKMPLNLFQNYYLGQFASVGGGAFGDFTKCINNSPERTGNYYMGIDWGTGQRQDSTAISIINDKRQLVDVYYYNDKEATESIDYIVGLIKKYNPKKIQVEINSIGRVFLDLLKKKMRSESIDIRVQEFNTTNDSKNRIVNQLQVAIQQEIVQFPENKELISQMNEYVSEKTPSGKITYNARSGCHDDIVFSFMLAYDLIVNNYGHYSFI